MGPRIVQDPPKEHSEVKGIQISGEAGGGRISDQGPEPHVRGASAWLLLSLDIGQRLWTVQASMEVLKLWDFCLSSIISVALVSVLGVTAT